MSSAANGVCTVKTNKPFIVKVANMSSRPVYVRKNQVIAHATPTPKWAYECNMTQDGPDLTNGRLVDIHQQSPVELSRLPSNEGGDRDYAVNCCTLFHVTGKECELTCIRRSKLASDANINLLANDPLEDNNDKYVVPDSVLDRISPAPNADQPLTTDRVYTLDDVDVKHLPHGQQDQVRNMLRPLSSMWTGQLGKVAMATHRIDIPKDSKPFRSQPYRAGFKDREIEDSEVQRQLKIRSYRTISVRVGQPCLVGP